MNNDYVTRLRIEQHRADVVRMAQDTRLGRPARRRRSGRLLQARLTLPWRHRRLATCHPEVAQA